MTGVQTCALPIFSPDKEAPLQYLIPQDAFLSGEIIPWKKDRLPDLLDMDSDKKVGITRWKFLSDAMFRLESGQHCFTWVEGERLRCCVWVRYADKNSTEKDDSSTPEKLISLENGYCHASAKDQLPAFLKRILITLSENKENSPIRFQAKDELICRAMKAAGFQSV